MVAPTTPPPTLSAGSFATEGRGRWMASTLPPCHPATVSRSSGWIVSASTPRSDAQAAAATVVVRGEGSGGSTVSRTLADEQRAQCLSKSLEPNGMEKW